MEYTANAAGTSWLAFVQTIDEQAKRQKEMLSLYRENTKASIDLAKTSSDQAGNELQAQADGLRAMGWAGIGGAIATVGIAGVSMAGELFCSKMAASATKEDQTATTTLGLNKTGEKTLSGVPSVQAETTIVGETTTTNTPPAGTGTPKTTTDNAANSNPRAAWWNAGASRFQSFGHNFNQLGSQLGQSIGSINQANYVIEQGQAAKAKTIAQGIEGVMNQQGQMEVSAIDDTNSQRANTAQTLGTIIRTATGV